ncbi:iron-containing alcohol dehydrogenase [Spiroplasma endosymbiont of Labia minor]|uniref:iron-containing alcohol dehydrogenase n=1 Tax=Spiroplasma endosymbiont of Labia minor TaxID=3066305 RepID=UPI0030D35C16
MIYDFQYYNPTKIYFGKNSLTSLNDELKNYGANILLVYGFSSIKKSGLYDKVIQILKNANKNIIELSGVMPNPTFKKMIEGAELVKRHSIDLILAVGGGSVIDISKGISAAAYCKTDPWEKFWIKHESVDTKITPIASILTMVGTASEMNGGSVITNEELTIKTGNVFSQELYPKFSILNPEYTFTVPEYQMVSGIADTMLHLLEQYFSGEDDNTSDYLIEGLLRSLFHSTPIAVKNPLDYESRSNIMWIATTALNNLVGLSKAQDWKVHQIEHQLSAYTDCAHGMGLATIAIPYYRYIYKYGLQKFKRFAINVFNVNPTTKTDDAIALEGLDLLSKFIKDSKMVTTLKELGATPEMLPKIANSVSDRGGAYKILNNDEILQILQNCYE